MRERSSLLVISILLIGMLTLTSCQHQQTVVVPTKSPVVLNTVPPEPTRTVETPLPSATPTATASPSPTPLPPTATPSHTPTAAWVSYEPGQVVAPILLYHHIDGDNTDSRYRVSIPDFRAQMEWLYEQGYTAITASMLLDVLLYGGELPEKPIVITFDDGHLSVYEHAFPLMDALGFPGVFYIVANRINNAEDFVHVEQIRTMAESGWEIGSHGYTHLDVTKDHGSANYEITQSKTDLQAALGVEINTFAYPYGEVDRFSAQTVSNAAYWGGMGLGTSITHTWNTVFYLSRIEIHGNITLDQFIALITPK